jgi:hypothetical protein
MELKQVIKTIYLVNLVPILIALSESTATQLGLGGLVQLQQMWPKHFKFFNEDNACKLQSQSPLKTDHVESGKSCKYMRITIKTFAL